MIINLVEFEDVLRRASINFLVDFVQLNITKDTIKSKMTNGKGSISIINIPNNMLIGMETGDELQLNFDDPQVGIIPFLSSLNAEEAKFEEKREKIQLTVDKVKTKISLAFPQDSKIFLPDAPKSTVVPFTTFNIDEDFLDAYNKVKKVASKFDKLYFTVDDGKLYLETTDKTNTASNGIKVDLFELDEESKVVCFPFKSFSNIMSLVGNSTEFKMSLVYIKEQQMGMLIIFREDLSENYYQFSIKE